MAFFLLNIVSGIKFYLQKVEKKGANGGLENYVNENFVLEYYIIILLVSTTNSVSCLDYNNIKSLYLGSTYCGFLFTPNLLLIKKEK